MVFRVFLIFMLWHSFALNAQKSKKSTIKYIKVEGQVTQTSQYCGGARPPDDLVKQLATPMPLPHVTLYIRSGATNDINSPILDSVQSDDRGYFSIKLKKGSYSIVGPSKKNTKVVNEYLETYQNETELYSAVQKDCYLYYVSQPDGQITISGNEKKAPKWVINYVNPCEYNAKRCVSFKGKLPQ